MHTHTEGRRAFESSLILLIGVESIKVGQTPSHLPHWDFNAQGLIKTHTYTQRKIGHTLLLDSGNSYMDFHEGHLRAIMLGATAVNERSSGTIPKRLLCLITVNKMPLFCSWPVMLRYCNQHSCVHAMCLCVCACIQSPRIWPCREGGSGRLIGNSNRSIRRLLQWKSYLSFGGLAWGEKTAFSSVIWAKEVLKKQYKNMRYSQKIFSSKLKIYVFEQHIKFPSSFNINKLRNLMWCIFVSNEMNQ